MLSLLCAEPCCAQSHLDDEYDPTSLLEPKVCVTTSREPSSRLKQFAKVPCLHIAVRVSVTCCWGVMQEVRLLFPNSQRVNRGSHKTEEVRVWLRILYHPCNGSHPQLVAACRSNGFTDVVVLHETRGEPGVYVWGVGVFDCHAVHPRWADC